MPLVKRLLGEGCEVRIYDRDVNHAHLMGTNREYIEAAVPHLADLMGDDARALLEGCDTVVVGNDSPEFTKLVAGTRKQAVVDLVALRLSEEQLQALGDRYLGISW